MASPTPHDDFVKGVFSRPDQAASVLQALLPAPLLAQLDLERMTLMNEYLPDPLVGPRRTDLLYSVPCAGREAFVYLMLEAQSTVDPLMALRVLIYMARIWDRWLKDQEDKGRSRHVRAPAILPVVLFHGPQGWTAATDLLDLIDLPPDALASVRPHLPAFRFILDDLHPQTDEALRARPGRILARLALLLLRHARDEPEALLRFLPTIADLLNGLGLRGDWELVVTYILEVAEAPAEDIAHAVRQRAHPKTLEVIVSTAADRLRAEGALQARRRTLIELLEARFQDVPEPALSQIAGADEATLAEWTKRVLTAPTLEAVFEPGHAGRPKHST